MRMKNLIPHLHIRRDKKRKKTHVKYTVIREVDGREVNGEMTLPLAWSLGAIIIRVGYYVRVLERKRFRIPVRMRKPNRIRL